MRFVAIYSFLILSFTLQASPNNFWSDIAEQQIVLPKYAERTVIPQEYRTLSLQLEELKTVLQKAPLEFTHKAKKSPLEITMPLPDGSTAVIEVVESPNMHPKLRKKYPMIRSFEGKGKYRTDIRMRFDVSLEGFHAIMNTAEGEIFIDPFAKGYHDYYICYYTKDYLIDPELLASIKHEHSFEEVETDLFDFPTPGTNSPFTKNQKNNVPVDLRKYRAAIACTGQYAQAHGGTTAGALSAMNVAMNRINFMLNREVAIRLELVENNDTLVFLDSSTDPYPSKEPSDMASQNSDVFNSRIGIGNYDIGHVFGGPCGSSGVVGVSGGVGIVCGANKAYGASCELETTDYFYIGIICHELGHQFGAEHTFNNCPNSGNQFNPSTAYEPGSGSTIMSYNNACGNQNLPFDGHYYFHVNSIEAMKIFSSEGDGSNCGETIVLDNIEPELTIPLQNGFFIPISTPFELTAMAMDVDEDDLTYCWEQYDKDYYTTDVGSPEGNEPSFVSLRPSVSPTRVLPKMASVINNTSDIYEVLPAYSRDLTFRCTVRDNAPEGGGTVWGEVAFQATETAGPFLVTNPNANSVVWNVGDYVEVNWDVANTDNSKVKCQYVNIKLSTDGGWTYPFTLVGHTANDGSSFVSVPDTLTTKARIRVEAANNIFFDISNANFEIAPAAIPGYSLNVSPFIQQVCQPDFATIDLMTDSLLGYDSLITFDIISGLPDDAIASFSENPLVPSQTSTLSIEYPGTSPDDLYEIVIRAIAPGADTSYRSVLIDVVNNDFSQLSQLTPFDGESGINLSTLFSWNSINNAQRYDFELSTDPVFGDSIIASAYGLTETEITPVIFLDENKFFFWRIRPINECGAGSFTEPFTFHTVNAQCSDPIKSSDTPITISGTGTPTIESTIDVTTDGIINDLNVPIVKGSYQPVNSLRITLISPAGTEAILFNRNCGNTVNLNIGFDDDAPSAIDCPPDDGIVFKPVDTLSIFNGESSKGIWTLRVKVASSGFGGGGALDEWELEFCADIAPKGPVLITNDTLFVPPGKTNWVVKDILEVTDEDNTPSELTYTVVTPPQHGTLYFSDVPLGAGDVFRQSSINANVMSYTHDDSETVYDYFTFVVTDGTGGFLPGHRFDIKMDPDAVVGTVELDFENDIDLFPNPTDGLINIRLLKPVNEKMSVRIFNVQGQEVINRLFDKPGKEVQLNASHLSNGLYLLSIRTKNGIVTKKMVVERL